jgi:hypothetical protein
MVSALVVQYGIVVLNLYFFTLYYTYTYILYYISTLYYTYILYYRNETAEQNVGANKTHVKIVIADDDPLYF